MCHGSHHKLCHFEQTVRWKIIMQYTLNKRKVLNIFMINIKEDLFVECLSRKIFLFVLSNVFFNSILDLPFFYDMAFINNNGDYLRGKLLIGQYFMSCLCIKEGLWMTQNNWKVPLLHSFDIDLPLGNTITICSLFPPGQNIQSTGTDTMNFQGFNLILLNNIQR